MKPGERTPTAHGPADHMNSAGIHEVQSLRPGHGFVDVLGDPLAVDLASAGFCQAFCPVHVNEKNSKALCTKAFGHLPIVPPKEAVILMQVRMLSLLVRIGEGDSAAARDSYERGKGTCAWREVFEVVLDDAFAEAVGPRYHGMR